MGEFPGSMELRDLDTEPTSPLPGHAAGLLPRPRTAVCLASTAGSQVLCSERFHPWLVPPLHGALQLGKNTAHGPKTGVGGRRLASSLIPLQTWVFSELLNSHSLKALKFHLGLKPRSPNFASSFVLQGVTYVVCQFSFSQATSGTL